MEFILDWRVVWYFILETGDRFSTGLIDVHVLHGAWHDGWGWGWRGGQVDPLHVAAVAGWRRVGLLTVGGTH